MENLPLFIPAGFIITTLLTFWLLYRATNHSFSVITIVFGWLLLQGALSLAGFYLQTAGTPPRFALLLVPPIILSIIVTVYWPYLFNINKLMLIHLVRIPVELVLYSLYLHHEVPRLMTFEAGNLDILSGVSAVFIYYFGYVKANISRRWLIVWNIAGLLLLFNIVIRAVLSAPFSFQRFGFEQPNIALLYSPFIWLPSFVVPAVFMAHLISLRKLIYKV